jgi:REP element-mobilizing transposase RayT
MILAFHSIFTAYGFWLPNEPRGSWSDYVGSWELAKFGKATTLTTRRSVAGRPYDRDLKRRMQTALKHPPVHFTGEQAREIVRGFASAPYILHACAVLPDHVHLVIAHMERDIRHAVGHLKSEATRALREGGWFEERSPWADHGWNVYLDSEGAVRRAIAYVEINPVREGKRRQTWRCVVPFDMAKARGANWSDSDLAAGLAPRARRKRRG